MLERSTATGIRMVGPAVLFACALLSAGGVAAQDRPLLSEEIRAAYEEGGVSRARARYQVIVEGESDAYEFDTQGMLTLAAEYAQASDVEASQAISMLAYEIAMAQFQGSDAGARMAAMLDSARQADEAREEEARTARAGAGPTVPLDRGAPRDDLARFFGLYGDPDAGNAANRQLFVTETCDGRLAFSGMWGDVAPFIMRSEGDTRFDQIVVSDFQAVAYRLDFEVGADGRAAALTHNLTADSSIERWPRDGDLPDGWEDCLDTEFRSP